MTAPRFDVTVWDADRCETASDVSESRVRDLREFAWRHDLHIRVERRAERVRGEGTYR